MEDYMESPMNPMVNHADKLEKMYPDSYTRIYPHVQYIVNSIADEGMYNLTSNDIDRMGEEAIKRSGMLNDPPMGHSRESIRDMTRALVVRDMHDRFRRRRFSPFFPFFFFPFDDFDREHRRHRRDFDFDRDRDRDRDRDHEWY